MELTLEKAVEIITDLVIGTDKEAIQDGFKFLDQYDKEKKKLLSSEAMEISTGKIVNH